MNWLNHILFLIETYSCLKLRGYLESLISKYPLKYLPLISSPANYLLYNQDLRMAVITNITMKTHYSLLITHYSLLVTRYSLLVTHSPPQLGRLLTGHDMTPNF